MSPSKLTSLAACLFAGGVVSLFAALFGAGMRGAPLLWVGIFLLTATIVCWMAAARANGRES